MFSYPTVRDSFKSAMLPTGIEKKELDIQNSVEFAKLIFCHPEYLSTINEKMSDDLLSYLLMNNKSRVDNFHKEIIHYIVRCYDTKSIIEYSLILMKEKPLLYEHIYHFIASDSLFLKQFIPHVLTLTSYMKNILIGTMYKKLYLTDDLLCLFKDEPNYILSLMDNSDRIRLVKSSFINNIPFNFDKIKLDATLCLSMLNELNIKFSTINEKLNFLVEKNLILKKNTVFITQFIPDVSEKLDNVYKTSELLGIKSRKEIAKTLLSTINLPKIDINIDIDI